MGFKEFKKIFKLNLLNQSKRETKVLLQELITSSDIWRL